MEFDNRDGSIHILKDGILDALLQFQCFMDAIVDYLPDQQFQILCSWLETPVHCLVQAIWPILSRRKNERLFGQSQPLMLDLFTGRTFG
jgi:hypothetical protein